MIDTIAYFRPCSTCRRPVLGGRDGPLPSGRAALAKTVGGLPGIGFGRSARVIVGTSACRPAFLRGDGGTHNVSPTSILTDAELDRWEQGIDNCSRRRPHSGKPPLESNATSSLTLTPAKIHSNKKNQYPRFLRKIYAAKNFGAWWGQTEFQVNLKLGLTRFPPHALTDSHRTRSGGRAGAVATSGT